MQDYQWKTNLRWKNRPILIPAVFLTTWNTNFINISHSRRMFSSRSVQARVVPSTQVLYGVDLYRVLRVVESKKTRLVQPCCRSC